MGCLTWPFKLLMLVVLALLLIGGWRYRDELLGWARARSGRHQPAPLVGRPGVPALVRARQSLAELGRPGAPSVTLDADEMASLVRESLDPMIRSQMDSLRVELGEGRIGLTALLRTARLPREVLGPLAVALRDRELIRAQGALRVARPGVAEWEVDRLMIGDIPLPREAIPRLIGRLFGDSTRRSLSLPLPRNVSGIRVAPAGVTLFATEAR